MMFRKTEYCIRCIVKTADQMKEDIKRNFVEYTEWDICIRVHFCENDCRIQEKATEHLQWEQ